ncbi:MAG: hypothetical protein OEQ53_12875 [Saprospiraceae bacterium]|nr:hypothetical protein [Saprospiraceae bacterium]
MRPLRVMLLSTAFMAFGLGCQNERSEPNPALSNVDLLRGEIILCSGESFGEVSFSLGCDYSVRETFNLAISLLHSFEYQEAEKAFVKVLDADPECAMAYWGVAMTIYHDAWFPPPEHDLIRASKILAAAESLSKDERESDYLEAIGAFYKDWETVDHKTRALNYEKEMEQMYTKYDDDMEAAIFYALALYATRDRTGTEYVNERKAGKILESIFPDQPNHPGIAHYIIHNYDNPNLAHLALPTARRYADIAPSSSHAQHMPSHIFTRLGLWDESIQSNLNSMSAAQCYAEEVDMEGHWDNEIHAMDYLVYAYLQKGDNESAGELYEYLQTIEKLVTLTGPYNFGAIAARMALENKDWEAAAELTQHPSDVEWKEFPWEIALTHFARVLGATHLKDVESARKDLAMLQSLQQELIEREDQYNADQVLVQVKSSEAWILLADGNNEAAVALMQEAAEMEDRVGKHPKTPGEVLPARELLGDMLLSLNRPSEAMQAYELDLKGHPNRFNGIYGAAVAARDMGDYEKSKIYFEKLLDIQVSSGSARPEIKEASAALEKI